MDNYKEKYLVMVNLRHEASSRFVGTKEPWGTFPSVSVGEQESCCSSLDHADTFHLEQMTFCLQEQLQGGKRGKCLKD